MSQPGKTAAEHLYWARSKSTPAPVQHKPLAPAEAAALEAQRQSRTGAAWNGASTWEEKDIAKWAHALLKEELLPQIAGRFTLSQADVAALPTAAQPAEGAAECSYRVTAVNAVSGDATHVLSRGKQGVVFELKLKLQLELELKLEGELRHILTGELHVPEVTNDEVDDSKMPSPKCSCEQSGMTPFFQRAAPQCWPSMQQVLRSLVEQAKEKWL